MEELFDPLYKRTKKGGFVIWKVEGDDNSGEVLITYGQTDGNPAQTTKWFSNKWVAVNEMTKIRNKKKAEGLYHTLDELGITHNENAWYNYYGLNNLKMVARLSDALNAKLPPLSGSPAKVPKPKAPKIDTEYMDIMSRNIPITIHLPRI